MAKKTAPKKAKATTPKKAAPRERVTAAASEPTKQPPAANADAEREKARVAAEKEGLPCAVPDSALDPNRSDNLVRRRKMVPAHLLVPGADPYA